MSPLHAVAAMIAAGLLSWTHATADRPGWATFSLGVGAAAWLLERVDATIEANKRRVGLDG